MSLRSLLALGVLVSLVSPSHAQDLTQQLLQNAPNATNTPVKKEPPKLSSPEPSTGLILGGLLALGIAKRRRRPQLRRA